MEEPRELYTQEQRQYVGSLPDDPATLKKHLLHQVRLRDNLRRDRDVFEQKCRELTERLITHQ